MFRARATVEEAVRVAVIQYAFRLHDDECVPIWLVAANALRYVVA